MYKYRGDCVVHLKRKHQKADTIAHTYVDKFNLDSLKIGDIYGLLKPRQHDEPENEEKLFGCAFCDYKANYKGDVYKHQTRRHPGTPKSVKSLARNGTDMNNTSLNSSSYQQSPDYKRHYTNNHNHNGADNRLSGNFNDDMDGDYYDEENGGVENDLDMNDDIDHQPVNHSWVILTLYFLNILALFQSKIFYVECIFTKNIKKFNSINIKIVKIKTSQKKSHK